MYKKQIQKFVGVKRSAKPCEDFSLKAKLDDYCTPGSLEDMLAQVWVFNDFQIDSPKAWAKVLVWLSD